MDRLFEKSIPNLDSLRNSINQHTAFVAIDVESMGDNIRDLGIALLPFESLFMGYGCAGISLGFFAIRHKVQAHNIRNQEFWQGVQRTVLYEKFDCGKGSTYMNLDSFETTIAAILKAFGRDHKNLLLVRYDLRREFPVLTELCPGIVPYFSGWFDLQLSIREISGRMLRLHDVYGALSGFKQAAHKLHCAGNDAVRTLGLLPTIISQPESIALKLCDPSQKTKRYNGRRIHLDYHPFNAVIRTVDRSPLPLELSIPRQVIRYFEKYEPKSVNKYQNSRCKATKLSYAYLSFNTRDLLQKFVSEVDGSCIGGKLLRVRWKVPPGTVPADVLTSREFYEAQRVSKQQRGGAVREEITAREQDIEQDMGFDSLFIG